MKSTFLYCIFSCFLIQLGFAQQSTIHVEVSGSFVPSNNKQVGFDALHFPEWQSLYSKWKSPQGNYLPVCYQSIVMNERSSVWFKWKSNTKNTLPSFRFQSNHVDCPFQQLNDSVIEISLPVATKNATVYAYLGTTEIAVLQTIVLNPQVITLELVPLVNGWQLNTDSITVALNEIYKQAAIQFRVRLTKQFVLSNRSPKKLLDEPFTNHDRFTAEMRKIRDAFLIRFPQTDQQVYTFFVVPGFQNSAELGASVHNKTLGFIKALPQRIFTAQLAKQLAVSMGGLQHSWELNGPKKGTTNHLMDVGDGTALRHDEWQALQHAHQNKSFTDGFEEIKTSIGITAYYFWKEDALGNIVLNGQNPLDAIKRPFKKNTFSYHLQIDNWLYATLFILQSRKIAFIHLLIAGLIFFASWKWGKRARKWLAVKRKKSRFLRFSFKLIVGCGAMILVYFCLGIVDLGYAWFEVDSGEIEALKNQSTPEVMEQLASSVHPFKLEESELCSEIIVNNNRSYFLKQRKRVLYFDVFLGADSSLKTMRFAKNSDSIQLKLNHISIPAKSHYCVLRYFNESGKCTAEKVFNHGGYELTDKLMGTDPPKRVMVFVNGYRPTSLGGNFESHFQDLKAHGLEFPNSYNHLYLEDKYDYWHPWNQIDTKFIQYLKATDVFYADGHFSVATSNHRSLLAFTTLSSRYPKRCGNAMAHHCYYQKGATNKLLGTKRKATKLMLPIHSNRAGFYERFKNGKIAGRNLIQALNELPNSSMNDTLYIVAHSMGFAYAQGMIAELRGKIQFGSYIIIAPENGRGGFVREAEWQQVMVYGSNLVKDAPCLQDGIAPQLKINGLTENHHGYIPNGNYHQKGFFDSHFVGYYTWIFNLMPNEIGYIHPN